MANPLLSKQVLNTMRRALYGNDAELRLYKITTGAAPTLLATLTDGWNLLRKSRSEAQSGDVQSANLLIATGATTEVILHQTSRVEMTTGGKSFAWNVSDTTPMQVLGSGHTITLTPTTMSTTTPE